MNSNYGIKEMKFNCVHNTTELHLIFQAYRTPKTNKTIYMVTEKDKHPQFAKAITKYITTQMKRPH
jgi:hypothetical protein